MKQSITKAITFIAMWSICLLPLHAADNFEFDMYHNSWMTASMDSGMNRPEIRMFYSHAEKAGNGMKYMHISEQVFGAPGDPSKIVTLPYGYRLADKEIYIYNFETEKETLAFDFRLKAGERFTTYNGMEWVVEEAGDTLVDVSPYVTGTCVPLRLLKVRSADGKRTDKWLENIGSLSTHLMTDDMENVMWSELLWTDYDQSRIFVREIGAKSFFTHDTGWMGNNTIVEGEDEYTRCSYKDGTVTLEEVSMRYPYRTYSCYYREGDDIYLLKDQFLPPMPDCTAALRKDVTTFKGLPEPASGQYVVHTNKGDFYTGISQVCVPAPAGPDALYDLQGRRLEKKPAKGIYIRNGKKEIVR